MTLIVFLFCLMLATLFAVSFINRIQLRHRHQRLEQRRLRVQTEGLIELVTSLKQTLPNRLITKHINDMVIVQQQKILALEKKNTEHIENAIQKSERYSEELLDPKLRTPVSFQRDSDAQIAKTQLHLNEASNLITYLAAQGSISEVELDEFLLELRWAYLMVSVMSYISQGDRAIAISDRFSAQAFYRKAQQLLMESMHPDSRRLKMIKELSEMIDGGRSALSGELN